MGRQLVLSRSALYSETYASNICYLLTMKIAVLGSMQFTEKMIEVGEELKKLGHDPVISNFAHKFVGKSDEEKELIKIRQKQEQDATKEMWDRMQACDAVLVLNYDKHGIKNYIGGNSFLELGFAYVLNKKIFLLNPIPNIPYYKTEMESMKPVVIYEDLNKIR